MKSAPWQSSCRAVQDRRTAQANSRHVQRLMNVKPSIDMRKPKALKYKRSRKNKQTVADKARQQQIQRDNNRMLRNLLEVDPSRRAERKQRFSRSKASENAAGSLNLINRQKKLNRITEENKKLLNRIINCAPTFDRHQFKQREKDHKRLLKRMAENSGNRQRPMSARGANPDRYMMEEMRTQAGLGNSEIAIKKKKRRPKSAGRTRPTYGNGENSINGSGGRSNNGRPSTAMARRRGRK